LHNSVKNKTEYYLIIPAPLKNLFDGLSNINYVISQNHGDHFSLILYLIKHPNRLQSQ